MDPAWWDRVQRMSFDGIIAIRDRSVKRELRVSRGHEAGAQDQQVGTHPRLAAGAAFCPAHGETARKGRGNRE